ncbi:MAG: pyridoxal-phosphate dependent enzyme, partial [Gemmatimonadaceae bacterium]
MNITPLPTTILYAPRLEERLGVRLIIATETFQRTGSFKFRAGYSVAQNIVQPMVISASSGNFGQGIALACKIFGKACTVVMPHNSAGVKVEAVRGYGATVDLVDTSKVARADRVAELAAAHPDAYVASAYDDPFVIDGNASLGTELAVLGADVVVAPIGGGGLTSGLILGLRRARSATKVVGAEPAMANDAARSLREGRIVRNEREPQTIADGARTLSVGAHNWTILQDGLDGIVEVPEDAIAEGLRLAFSLANLKVEPTGALAIGAV